MNAYQKAKLLMTKGLDQLFDENPLLVATLVAFLSAVNALKAKIAEIDEEVQFTALNLAGIAADKKNSKLTLCRIAAEIAAMIYAYSAKVGNQTLKQEVNYTEYKLKRLRDTEIALVCQTIRERGTANLAALGDYGVTSALLDDLDAAIDAFNAAMPKPRTAIGKRKSRKVILKQLFKELDEIVYEQLDKLIVHFRTSHPEFYEAYLALRDVPDPSSTTTQLKGVITDKADNSPIKDAVITIVELDKTAKSNASGNYLFKPAAFGTYTITVTKEGYQDFQADELEVKLGDITHLNVQLIAV